ncbi:MAG: 2-oxoacid:acceptor oxidoreductase family protein [Thiolinea sp.]
MFQIRIHGRGGQGVVTAAEILSIAAFNEDRHAQAFPSFGSERMGAPVMAFCRIDDKEIRLREPVLHPDALIIQDPGLLHQVNLFEELAEHGYILVNSNHSLATLGLDEFLAHHPEEQIRVIPASDIARQYIGRPLPNAALLGGFAALTGLLKMASLEDAIRSKFSGQIAAQNIAAAQAAFASVQQGGTPC